MDSRWLNPHVMLPPCTLRTFATLALLLAAATFGAAAGTPTLHLIGDSTLSDKPLVPPQPERGWGMDLRDRFARPEAVANHARNGRSTKSFIDEGLWQAALARVAPGDFVLIQFGHNDQKSEDPKRFTAPREAYADNLRRFVRETREAGATPLLATSVVRRRWNASGAFFDTHGDYPDAVRAVARELGVPLLDLHRATMACVQALGPEKSKELFLWIEPGAYASLPDGKRDDTHFSALGAATVAQLAIEELRRLGLPVDDWLARP